MGGPNVGVQVEVHRRSLTDGDILLLCTDGLTEYVPDPEIAEILAQSADPEQAAHRLIDVVLLRAAKDNVTVPWQDSRSDRDSSPNSTAGRMRIARTASLAIHFRISFGVRPRRFPLRQLLISRSFDKSLIQVGLVDTAGKIDVELMQ